MRLSNLRDEDLKEVAKLKNRKGCATSEAKRAAQILLTRNKTLGFSNHYRVPITTHLDVNVERDYRSFEELHGMTLAEYTLVHGK